MRVAVVDENGFVENVIVADPDKDQIGGGRRLVRIPDETVIDQRWKYSEKLGFYPGAELAAKREYLRDPAVVAGLRAARQKEIDDASKVTRNAR